MFKIAVTEFWTEYLPMVESDLTDTEWTENNEVADWSANESN